MKQRSKGTASAWVSRLIGVSKSSSENRKAWYDKAAIGGGLLPEPNFSYPSAEPGGKLHTVHSLPLAGNPALKLNGGDHLPVVRSPTRHAVIAQGFVDEVIVKHFDVFHIA